MALIHWDASNDFPEKSARRAALSSVVLDDIAGGGVKGCCGRG